MKRVITTSSSQTKRSLFNFVKNEIALITKQNELLRKRFHMHKFDPDLNNSSPATPAPPAPTHPSQHTLERMLKDLARQHHEYNLRHPQTTSTPASASAFSNNESKEQTASATTEEEASFKMNNTFALALTAVVCFYYYLQMTRGITIIWPGTLVSVPLIMEELKEGKNVEQNLSTLRRLHEHQILFPYMQDLENILVKMMLDPKTNPTSYHSVVLTCQKFMLEDMSNYWLDRFTEPSILNQLSQASITAATTPLGSDMARILARLFTKPYAHDKLLEKGPVAEWWTKLLDSSVGINNIAARALVIDIVQALLVAETATIDPCKKMIKDDQEFTQQLQKLMQTTKDKISSLRIAKLLETANKLTGQKSTAVDTTTKLILYSIGYFCAYAGIKRFARRPVIFLITNLLMGMKLGGLYDGRGHNVLTKDSYITYPLYWYFLFYSSLFNNKSLMLTFAAAVIFAPGPLMM